jgi:hypothetical protein
MVTLETVGTRRPRTLGFAGLALGVTVVIAAVVFALTSSPSRTRHSAKGNRAPRESTLTDTPFAANSIWNASLAANAPLAPDSSVLVKELEQQISSYGTWINTDSYSTPIYTVPKSQPRVPVTLDVSGYASATELASAFHAGVPIPPTARPAPGTDADMVVWQPSTDTMWELWNARRVGATWHARWGGRMDDVSENPGYFTDPPDWGTTATSLALLGGTIRISDLRAGHIDHALAISIPHARRGVVAWPAQRTDGDLDSPDAIPEGTRFRLDPSLNLNQLNLPPLTRMIAQAAQRYGLFVRDQSGAVAFYGEQVTQPGPNPYTGPGGVFGNLGPEQVTAAFPWKYLEVVNAPVHAYQ